MQTSFLRRGARYKSMLQIKSARSVSAPFALRTIFSTASCTSSASESPLNARTVPLSSYGPIGVAAALHASSATPSVPTLFSHEFSLADRVALVSGGNRGIGLEMAMTLVEAGARAVYCVDLPKHPGEEWKKVKEYLERMEGKAGEGRLEYLSVDVRDQSAVWNVGERLGTEKGVWIDAISRGKCPDCYEIPRVQTEISAQVMEVNVNGVLYTAQAAGRQMARFGNGGSVILIASISGHGTNMVGGSFFPLGSCCNGSPLIPKNHACVSYNTSKSGVLQMTRSMACELGIKRIRVNSISPGYISTKCVPLQRAQATLIDSCVSDFFHPPLACFRIESHTNRILLTILQHSPLWNRMTGAFLDMQPRLLEMWASQNPLGRIGRRDELRGVVAWLASDASTFCTGSDIVVSGGHHSW
ncbi:putative NADP-dependent mannitol dehydrogenase [Grifola frondosa]|uniref:Putative NADP-dependent mannitol dehydrogenase n=1 Tax=Grifola frondosa TaxID=5627 RepID=A0A1C7LQ63_GRIFR|nr:putative NADP-dependent mannitol dehydrogenase [Grifola frondosa]